MDNDTDTLTIPHELYVRLSSYASSRCEAPESLVATWLRERLSADDVQQISADDIQARVAAISALDGILSAPVDRDWPNDHMSEPLDFADPLNGFVYPHELVRVMNLGLVHLEPWWIMEGTLLRDRLVGVRKRYPTRKLVPFARRQDNDDLACFNLDNGKVAIIHDFASPGYEQRAEFADFYEWLRQAVEDLIEFERTGAS